MSALTNIVVVYHSGNGHTEKLAHAVAQGIGRKGSQAHIMSVDNLQDFNWDQLVQADAIIFGSPTYMGGVSAAFKAFIDASAGVWFKQGWKDKLAAGFTNSGSMSGDKLSTLQQMSIFAAQHGMMWVSLGLMPGNNSSVGSIEDLNRLGSFLGAMAQSNADQSADIVPPKADLETAKALGERVALAVLRWKI
ncbi:flavodoxin family protein [Vibrio aestuarianus]|uniref:Flavodoxin family protein n=1 Tax=Vibrio aestuarianus TaxID=28171 RepID=A0A9X4F0J1_9VIBR|nr:flavodoxin family protein [Vibrio aestuarianus]MDE1244193.1 flavodoxin family protein [Vibrio aestuarianus]